MRMSRGIVQSMGGLITVRSTPQRAATFRVYLPLTAAVAEPAPAGSLSVATILVVDDEVEVGEAVRRV
ncbi:MAG: hybrid sensor histidine kinase/response regulator, partial [Gammaproteobacteria bacterium]|nr:hybrid sensor histidine kinase/response regulator [Gammaproteobacteria bacterium]